MRKMWVRWSIFVFGIVLVLVILLVIRDNGDFISLNKPVSAVYSNTGDCLLMYDTKHPEKENTIIGGICTGKHDTPEDERSVKSFFYYINMMHKKSIMVKSYRDNSRGIELIYDDGTHVIWDNGRYAMKVKR